MIKFVKFKDVTDSINACNHCHYGCNGTRDANNCGHCNECEGGLFTNKPPTQQRTSPRKPTHKCKVCGALWMKRKDGTWSLISCRCGVCCDNAEMGKQMLPINAKRTRPRKSRDRRLLEALLDELSIHIYSDGQGGFMFTEKRCAGHLKPSEAKQLIAIKQAMEKKGKSQ